MRTGCTKTIESSQLSVQIGVAVDVDVLQRRGKLFERDHAFELVLVSVQQPQALGKVFEVERPCKVILVDEEELESTVRSVAEGNTTKADIATFLRRGLRP